MQMSPLTLGAWLDAQVEADAAVKTALAALAAAAALLDERIGLWAVATPAQDVGRNADGDAQHALDLVADEAYAHALTQTGSVRWYASEERTDVIELTSTGVLAVALDPLDGSSNIAINGQLGSIFSIYPACKAPLSSFIRPGREQAAAGYVLFGAQTLLAFTLGAGVRVFQLERNTQTFFDQGPAVTPASSNEYAINASNRRHWPNAIRAYIEDCERGALGVLGRDCNMRWTAALVADAHRILKRGGVFLYPQDARPRYGRGRLRMIYECAPIAFLLEQAGGLATDGQTRILDLAPEGLHDRCPLVFGSADMVKRIGAYPPVSAACAAPLFSERGLLKG
jgi:fructose-1,6-bisphosphatase I